MRSLISHLRYTTRLLLKSPGFTVTAILILALGIGTNTAIFSLVNGVLLKPLPYPNPDRLVSIYTTVPGFNNFGLAYPDYRELRRDQRTFVDLTSYSGDYFTLTGRGEAELISGIYASGGLFKILGRPFLLGAPFGETEDQSETRPVVVISEHLWKTRFQKDPKVLGTTLSLNGRSFQIIGVTPAQADEWDNVDVYVPLPQSSVFRDYENMRGVFGFQAVGRLKEGVSLQEARKDLEAINRRLAGEYPTTNHAAGIRLVPYLDSVVGDYTTGLWLLEVAAGCLLLITCANVANLLIARIQDRRREMMIRAALGASQIRLITQLLLETAMLALAGGILGLLLAFWAVGLMRSLYPTDITRFQEVELDQGSLIFVLGITLCTAIFAGVLPALAGSKADVTPALGEGGERTATGGPLRQKRQAFLVGGQVALTCVLLTGAGLLTRSYQILLGTPLGFKTHNVLTGDIDLTTNKYSDAQKSKTLFKEILDKLQTLPGVSGAALSTGLPFRTAGAMLFGVVGQPEPELGHEPTTMPQWISNHYFSVLGIPLLRGRIFNDQDQADTQRVVIVNESLAHHFFPGQDPIGKQLHDFGEKVGRKRESITIVGVVPDVEHNSPELSQASFQTYYPYTQSDESLSATLVLAYDRGASGLLAAVRKKIASIDSDVPFSRVAPFDEVIGKGFRARRLSLLVVGFFSASALLLATVGLYAVLSYSVIQRKREVGVRIALGAQTRNILQLIMRQGFQIVMVGLAIGLVGSLVMTRFIQGMLYQVPAIDLPTLVVALLTLAIVALLACFLPAFRASRINPNKALRE
jgi:predicted permease